MTREDERHSSGSREQRKNWTMRYGWLLTFLCILIVSLGGTLIKTWANTNKALTLAKENKETLKNPAPHIKEKLDDHIDDFKIFSAEQRIDNRIITSDIKKILHIVQERGI